MFSSISKMSLAAKIGLGFAIILVLAACLGMLAVFKMGAVSTQSTMLADEYVPEVAVANKLRGASNRLMYQMRGYGMTEQDNFLKAAEDEYKAVATALDEAQALASSSQNLKALAGQVTAAKTASDNYHGFMEDTEKSVAVMNAARAKLDANAAAYMQACNTFLEGQNAKFQSDLSSRDEKLSLIEKVQDFGVATRVGNFKGQARNDEQEIRSAIANLEKAFPEVDSLIALSTSTDDKKALNAITAAGKRYQAAIQSYLANKGVNESQYLSEMDAAAAQWVENVEFYLDGQRSKLVSDMSRRQRLITVVNDIIDLGNDTRVNVFKAQALRDQSVLALARENFPKMEEKFTALKADIQDPADLALVAQTQQAATGYGAAIAEAQGAWSTLDGLAVKRETAGQELITACKTTADAGMAATQDIANGARDSLNAASIVMLIGLAIVAVFGIILAVVITKGIAGPLGRVVEALRSGSEQVSSASGQVSSSSQQMAGGASEQAASLEETSASLEEMAANIKQNADNSMSANAKAQDIAGAAAKSREAMTRMVQAMNEIKSSADQTARIVKTIDEIAFQTNLLALNAAVEAARAGEAGKGFAVVAEEVRSLAQRSAEAAKDTSRLIEGSQVNTNNGVKVSAEVNEVLETIVTGVQEMSVLIGEVSTASDEQARGIDQINQAVAQMDQVTQSNAANAEESASASEELQAQAMELGSMVVELQQLMRGASDGAAPIRAIAHAPAPKLTSHAPAKAIGHLPPKLRSAAKPAAKKSAKAEIPFDDDFGDF